MKEMKRIAILIIAMMVTMPAICAISLVISDRQKENLKGPVKSVREYLLSKQEYYDADTVALYKKLGKELPKYQKELFTDTRFDRQGRKTYEYDAVFERTNKYVYGVDGSMLPTLQNTKYSDGSSRRYEIVQDSNGFPQTGKAVNDDNDVIFTETYTYSKLANGNLQMTVRHRDAASGNESVTMMVLRPDKTIAELIMGRHILMDENEEPTEIKTNSEHIFIQHNGNTEISGIYVNGQFKKQVERVKDQYGNMVKKTNYKHDGEVTTYTYKYDSHGNWISMTSSSGNGEPSVYIREITYY